MALTKQQQCLWASQGVSGIWAEKPSPTQGVLGRLSAYRGVSGRLRASPCVSRCHRAFWGVPDILAPNHRWCLAPAEEAKQRQYNRLLPAGRPTCWRWNLVYIQTSCGVQQQSVRLLEDGVEVVHLSAKPQYLVNFSNVVQRMFWCGSSILECFHVGCKTILWCSSCGSCS